MNKLVPIEPTEKMIAAPLIREVTETEDLYVGIYKSMLAAAPILPAQSNVWKDAVLLQCMTIEGCYNENDPIATINCLIDWHVRMTAEDISEDTIISWNSDLEETAKEVIAAFRAHKTKLPDRILNALHELNVVLNTK